MRGLQKLWCRGLVTFWHVKSSQTRDRTWVPCIGRQTLNLLDHLRSPLSYLGNDHKIFISFINHVRVPENQLSNCNAQASHCGGFSCCRAWDLDAWASVVVAHGLRYSIACGDSRFGGVKLFCWERVMSSAEGFLCSRIQLLCLSHSASSSL